MRGHFLAGLWLSEECGTHSTHPPLLVACGAKMGLIWGPPDETKQEYLEDLCLGVSFVILTLWSGNRLAVALPALKHSIDRGGG